MTSNGEERRCRIIVVTNQKGGVGKTTTAINLAAGLAAYHEKQVLLVDFDPQVNATRGLGLRPGDASENPFSSILVDPPRKGGGVERLLHCIVQTQVPNLYLIPGDRALRNVLKGPRALHNALQELFGEVDYIIIDTPPGIDNVTTNAVTAADFAIVPCERSIFSFEGLADVLDLVGQCKSFPNGGGPKQFCHIVLTKTDDRCKRSKAYAEEELGGYEGSIFETIIRNNDALNQANTAGLSIFHYDPSSNGARDYNALTQEVLAL